jgi:dTDP-4-dehydrorhamnose reductase
MGKGKLLVTGANGLLGNKIIRLAQNNYVATPIHHIKPLHSKSQKLDIRDANAVLNLFDKFEQLFTLHLKPT